MESKGLEPHDIPTLLGALIVLFFVLLCRTLGGLTPSLCINTFLVWLVFIWLVRALNRR